MDQAVQLPHIRQPPVPSAGTVIKPAISAIMISRAIKERIGEVEGITPIHRSAVAIGIRKPNQPRQIVRHGAIAVVRKAG